MPIVDFEEVRFPEKIAYSPLGGPQFKTTVNELASGFEQRNVEWSKALGRWDVAYGPKREADKELILNFFMARRGRAIGFRFKDWIDYKLPRQSIGLTNGAATTFQIYKRYPSGPGFYDHDIKKVVSGTLLMWVNGAQIGSPNVDVNTGIVTLTGPQAVTIGQNIEIQCEFDKPVRFDTDHFTGTVSNFKTYEWQNIVIKELRV